MPYCVNPRCFNPTESATHCSLCSSATSSSSSFYPLQAKHDGSKIKLVYFENIWGRAEPIRWALSVAGIPFEDARVPWNEFQRQSEAGEFPYATLPTMYVGDRQIGQSRAALRYVGRVGGLYPEDPVTAGQCDAVIDALADLMLQLGPSMRNNNPDEKKTMREALLPVFAEYFNYFEHALGRNTSGSGGGIHKVFPSGKPVHLVFVAATTTRTIEQRNHLGKRDGSTISRLRCMPTGQYL